MRDLQREGYTSFNDITNPTLSHPKMWNETDLDDQDHQFIPEHLVNHLPRQKENGEFGHVRPGSHGNLVESQHSHLLGVPSHDMLTDAMLGHIGIGERDRDQVTT